MKNMIYTKGFINNSGDIEVPGVFLEEGAHPISNKSGM